MFAMEDSSYFRANHIESDQKFNRALSCNDSLGTETGGKVNGTI